MNKNEFRKLIVDGIARVETGDENVKSICVNEEITKNIHLHLLDYFDQYTGEPIHNDDLGELIGSLFGAKVYFCRSLTGILFIGEYGTLINIPYKKIPISTKNEQLDKQNKFKFIYERI